MLDVLEVLLGVVLDTDVVVVVVRAADWVEVEPPHPASAPTTARTARTARPEDIRLNGIDRGPYPSPAAVTSSVSISEDVLGRQLHRGELHVPRQAAHLARVDQAGPQAPGGLRAAGHAEAQALLW